MTVAQDRRLARFFLFILFFFVLNSQSYAGVLSPQADMYRAQGLGEQERGQYKSALNFFLKAASMSPENAVLYNDIGINYEQLGYTDRAEQYYLRSLKIDSMYLPAYSNLAYLYASLGELDKAKTYFLERLKLAGSNDPWKEKIRAELYRIDPSYKESAIKEEMEASARRLAEEAKKKEQAEISLSIERAQNHFDRGQNFVKEKKYKDAVSEYEQALALTPDNPKILKAKKLALYEERIDEVKHRIAVATQEIDGGKLESAKKEIQQILAIIPKESFQQDK